VIYTTTHSNTVKRLKLGLEALIKKETQPLHGHLDDDLAMI
jgi:hypothetical protein